MEAICAESNYLLARSQFQFKEPFAETIARMLRGPFAPYHGENVASILLVQFTGTSSSLKWLLKTDNITVIECMLCCFIVLVLRLSNCYVVIEL